MEGRRFVIVDPADVARPPTRWWRLPRVLVGLVVLIAGLVALLPAMFIISSLLLALRLQGSVDVGDDPSIWLWVIGSFLVGYVVVSLGVRLLRGRRRSALFLRRFGFQEATEAVSVALARGLGRRWRLVTLDDLEVAPLGVGGRSRWLFRFGPWVLGAVFVGLVFWFVPLWFESTFEGALESVFDDTVARAEEEGRNPIEVLFEVLVVGLVVGVIVGLGLMVALLAPVALAGSALLFTLGGRRGIRRAEERRTVMIARQRDIDEKVRRVRRTTRRIYAPRLTVVRCSNQVWQRVVLAFAGITDTVIVDVSEPSAGLLWELTELGPRFVDRWVLVGDRDSLEALAGERTSAAVRLRELLDGQRVLAYRDGELKRFEAALRTLLRRSL